jgi:small subunit ribosomal protein S1
LPAENPQEVPGNNMPEANNVEEKTLIPEGGIQDPEEDNLPIEEYEKLLDQYNANVAEGEVVKGKILQISSSEVVVDVGYKSEGIIRTEEFLDEFGKPSVQVGDEVEVLLEKVENREGYLILSREKAEKMKVWDQIESAYQSKEVVTGRVIERIKGGLAVDIGVRAFLPGSQVDVRPVRNLESLRGQELRMRVIKVNKKRGNIVLSRKVVLEEELTELKEKTLIALEEGRVFRGVVKNLTDYGAFIDLGGIDGLLHITDMSYGRINHPSELFNVSDQVEVVVLKFDRETERVSLGYKQLTPDPWESATDRYPISTRVKGKVVSLTDYGAFIELEPGVEGLIHVSEMSWSKRVKHPSKVLSVGDPVEAMVLQVDPNERRISLGLKQVEPNPWELLAEKYEMGSRIEGKVRNLTDFGAFVEVEEGIDGLIHISDLTWNKRVKHPSEVIKKGDTVEAVVLNIDADNQRLSLGLKQLATDIWEEFFNNHHVGDVVEGKIVRLTNFGAFVEVEEGIEGLLHVSELDEERVEKPEDRLKMGESHRMKIIKISETERKIGLSIRAVDMEDYESHMTSQGSPNATLGDIADFDAAEFEIKNPRDDAYSRDEKTDDEEE